MLSLEEAQARAIGLVTKSGTEVVPVEMAQGRYLAGDLFATRTQPSANMSAMDGYAVGDRGIDGKLEWELVGESRAGTPYSRALEAGETIRISTGAHLPVGADRIVIQENVQIEGSQISCFQDFPDPERHVRLAGFDFESGDPVMRSGSLIGAAQIALAITAGHGALSVATRPTVAILDSGDELAADPQNCGLHQIPASNGAMIAAMVRELGCNVVRLGPVGDNHADLAVALRGAEDADVLVTTGGASVGDHDLMRPALERWGAELDFWKVAMKPGKPVMVGRRGQQLIFGLPGNPVSSFVTCFLLVLPAIRAAMRARDPLPKSAQLPVGEDLPGIGSRREFLRGIWDGTSVIRGDSQDSSALFALAGSNCLIYRTANAAPLAAGEHATVFML
jgi:molybdopterin molybdotransferase